LLCFLLSLRTPCRTGRYFVDGDKCICQTNAVFWYIGDKYNLNGSTPEEKMNNMQLLNEIYDVRNKMIETVYPFKQVRR